MPDTAEELNEQLNQMRIDYYPTTHWLNPPTLNPTLVNTIVREVLETISTQNEPILLTMTNAYTLEG